MSQGHYLDYLYLKIQHKKALVKDDVYIFKIKCFEVNKSADRNMLMLYARILDTTLFTKINKIVVIHVVLKCLLR